MVDHHVGTDVFEYLHLGCATGDCDGLGTHGLGQLDCRRTGAPGCARNQHGLASLQLGSILECIERGAVVDRNRCCRCCRYAIGHREQPGCRMHGLFRKATASEVRDTLADFDARDALAERCDGATRLATRDMTGVRLHLVHPPTRQDVGESEADSLLIDEYLARARYGCGLIEKFELVEWVTVGFESPNLHVGDSTRSLRRAFSRGERKTDALLSCRQPGGRDRPNAVRGAPCAGSCRPGSSATVRPAARCALASCTSRVDRRRAIGSRR